MRLNGARSPLPPTAHAADLTAAAPSSPATLQRFRDLALDRHSWLYVTHAAAATTHDDAAASASPGSAEQQQRRRRSLAPAPLPDGPAATATPEGPHWYRSQFSSLEAALAASRPGDTILLEPGPGEGLRQAGARGAGMPALGPCRVVCRWARCATRPVSAFAPRAPVPLSPPYWNPPAAAAPHRVPAMLVVPHPVHILGGGAASGECVVEGARGLEALVDFRCGGLLAGCGVVRCRSRGCRWPGCCVAGGRPCCLHVRAVHEL